MSEFSVALAAASEGKRCVQGVKICGLRCKQSEDDMESSHGIGIIHLFSTIF